MNSELGTSTGTTRSGGGNTSSSGDSSVVSTLSSPIVVTAPPVKEAGSEEKDKATETAIKLLAAVDSIAAQPATGGYDQIDWKTKRAAMPLTAQSSSSTSTKSLTLMESIISPSPFTGSRTRKGGFMLAGLTPFIRLSARQGGEVIGAGRVPVLSSTASSTRAGGSRSSRRLKEEGLMIGEEGVKNRKHDPATRQLTTSDANKNVASMTLNAPQQALLLEHRQLLEDDWEAYDLGRSGGTCKVECTQLDVQNEV
uniref:Uncharacterized protein n=1 Tax=Chromera velia CCMP2878 TaxID=1169474 RepID=A0A0G4FTW5_9ALVE|eukprot:Cvel_18617.t1-p1 / transcript=Cvel_18617.t1 / gene=Cvel_18617 / organism=Chromera_velia_CCMP2878 / gene_product=hypothetical protein / transcript_product=hypothetical protein / location=Cvel_scaffold1554:13849-15110(+) / protein_length=253 / sequence_SO=supercontig / SO=protein_coding / is_pseudo=false